MKNVLFATTALVATAGIASAEVTGSGPGTINITGSAEMGIRGGEDIVFIGGFGFGTVDVDPSFHTDINVTFAMTGTSDNGLVFGATVDLEDAIGGGSATGNDFDDGGVSMFVSAGGATLTMGDTNGAFDQAIKETTFAGGSIADNEEHVAYGGYGNNGLDGGFDGQIARFDYTFDGFTASLSAEIDDTGVNDPIWGLGVRYEGDVSGVALGVGLGYQQSEDLAASNVLGTGTLGYFDTSIMGVSVDAGFSNGVTVGFSYSQADFDGTDSTHGAVGLGYDMNALSIGVNYGHYTIDGDEYTSGFGLAAAYDMGGGLSAEFGYGHSTVRDTFTFTGDDEVGNSWSIGLAMSF